MYIHAASIRLMKALYSYSVLIKVPLSPLSLQLDSSFLLLTSHGSSGLGRSAALRFSELGYTVFALFPNEMRQEDEGISDVAAVSGLILLSPPDPDVVFSFSTSGITAKNDRVRYHGESWRPCHWTFGQLRSGTGSVKPSRLSAPNTTSI